MTEASTRVDVHAKVLDESVVARAKDRGVEVLVYAPHFVRLPKIRRRAARFSDEELLVVPAREVFTGEWRTRRHVLAVGLSDPVPDFITLSGAMAEFRRQGAAVLVPHPEFLTMSAGESDIREYDDDIHAVETYNLKCPRRFNHRAREIADATGHLGFASSYAHLPSTVGEAWTRFEAAIDSEAELVAALKEGVPRTAAHRTGRIHRLHRLAELSHLTYENTWKKLDRVLLSGLEPTHPRHVAYDERFDDVSVY